VDRRSQNIKANQVDRGHSFFAGLRFLHAKRVEPGHDIFENSEPGKQREGLKNHRDPLYRPIHVFALIGDFAGGRPHQTGGDAQERGFAAAGAS